MHFRHVKEPSVRGFVPLGFPSVPLAGGGSIPLRGLF